MTDRRTDGQNWNKKLSWCWQTHATPWYRVERTMRGRVIAYFQFSKWRPSAAFLDFLYFRNFCEKFKFTRFYAYIGLSSLSCKISWRSDYPLVMGRCRYLTSVSVFGIFVGIFTSRFGIRYRYFKISRYRFGISIFQLVHFKGYGYWFIVCSSMRRLSSVTCLS